MTSGKTMQWSDINIVCKFSKYTWSSIHKVDIMLEILLDLIDRSDIILKGFLKEFIVYFIFSRTLKYFINKQRMN